MILFLRLWKNGKIPFTYRGHIRRDQFKYRRDIIERALQEIQGYSCVEFEFLKLNELQKYPDYL